MNSLIANRIDRVFWSVWIVATIALGILWLSSNPASQSLALRTLLLGLGAAVVAIPLGACLVWIGRQPGTIPRIVFLTTIVLLFVPIFSQVSAWDAAFGRLGWLTSTRGGVLKPLVSGWSAAIWIHGVAAAPQIAVLLFVGLGGERKSFEEQALLDTSPLGVFWHVTISRIWPLVVLAVLWTMLVCAREIAVTDLYQIGTLAEQVYLGFSLGGVNANTTAGSGWTPEKIAELGTPESGITVALIGWLAVSAALVFVRLTNFSSRCRETSDACSGATELSRIQLHQTEFTLIDNTQGRQIQLNQRTWLRSTVGIGLLLLMVLVPLGNLVVRCCYFVRPVDGIPTPGYSISQMAVVLSRACTDYTAEFTWSFLIAGSAATLILLGAMVLSWLARTSRGWQCLLLVTLAVSCAIPGPLMGNWIGDGFRAFDWPAVSWLYNRTILPPVLASVWYCWPLAPLVVWFVFRGVVIDVTEQAALDGAGRWTQFFRFGIFENRWAMFGCWLISFAFCWGELAASQLVIPPGVDTVPRLMLGLLHAGVNEMTAALTIVISGVILLVSLVSGLCLRLNRGGIGRQ